MSKDRGRLESGFSLEITKIHSGNRGSGSLTKLGQHCGVEGKSGSCLCREGLLMSRRAPGVLEGSSPGDPRRTLLVEGGTSPDPNSNPVPKRKQKTEEDPRRPLVGKPQDPNIYFTQ